MNSYLSKLDWNSLNLFPRLDSGESETFLQKAIQEQGRGRVLDTIKEIQERHDAVKDMEKNLKELHQVFLDMAVLVQAQGEQLDDIESHVARANSFVRSGAQQLQTARKHQKNTRKWTCYAIILLLVIILIVILSLKPWNWGGNGGGGQPNPPATPSPPSVWLVNHASLRSFHTPRCILVYSSCLRLSRTSVIIVIILFNYYYYYYVTWSLFLFSCLFCK